MQLAGKNAFVTGAASGLGRETCRAFVEAGASVIAMDLNAASADALAADLGGRVRGIGGDVADEAAVRAAIDFVRDAFGPLHLAVSCAGVGDAAKTVSRGEAFPLATWNKVIGVNLTGTFNVLRLAALAMSGNAPDDETGERGIIINTASGAATQGQVGQVAYSASKAGVIGMTLPAARDLASFGIRVVTISPGLFETPMVAGLPENVVQALVDKTMLFPARMGRPAEFAALACQIVENPYLNATVIDLDGGARMSAK